MDRPDKCQLNSITIAVTGGDTGDDSGYDEVDIGQTIQKDKGPSPMKLQAASSILNKAVHRCKGKHPKENLAPVVATGRVPGEDVNDFGDFGEYAIIGDPTDSTKNAKTNYADICGKDNGKSTEIVTKGDSVGYYNVSCGCIVYPNYYNLTERCKHTEKCQTGNKDVNGDWSDMDHTTVNNPDSVSSNNTLTDVSSKTITLPEKPSLSLDPDNPQEHNYYCLEEPGYDLCQRESCVVMVDNSCYTGDSSDS